MNSISNDFVTIEFENEEQQKIANYYMKLFNKEPEFYKGLLNGKTIIHSDELISIPYFIIEASEEKAIENIIRCTITKICNSNYECEYIPTTRDIYVVISIVITTPNDKFLCEEKDIYYCLAYAYFNNTKDFTYLKKCLYDNDINADDIRFLCYHAVMNNFNDLIKEKIAKDIEEIKKNETIYENLEGLMEILKSTLYNIGINATEIKDIATDNINNNIIDSLENTLPILEDDKYEELVQETLAYIDPTNNLLAEYLDCKKDNRIEKIKEENNETDRSCCFKTIDGKYIIIVSIHNNIIDVINCIHEFAHLHYNMITEDGTKPNPLVNEYPSIYFELKAAEYLLKKGYSKEEVTIAKSFRTRTNVDNVIYLFSTIEAINKNKNKDKNDFDISNFERIKESFDGMAEDIAKMIGQDIDCSSYVENLKIKILYELLRPAKTISDAIMYLVGTYFAEFSIANLKHEDVLTILENTRLHKKSLYRIIKMHGLNPEVFGFKEDSAEIKSIVKKIDDIDNQ